MMSFEGATCKEGIVTARKPGYVRVRFADLDDLQTAWLPVLHAFTHGDRQLHPVKLGAQAACVMDARLERGWVVGFLYSDVDAPPSDSNDGDVTAYEDGTLIEYNKGSHTLKVKIGGCTATVSASGINVTGGDVVADGISLKDHLTTGVVPGLGKSSIPSAN